MSDIDPIPVHRVMASNHRTRLFAVLVVIAIALAVLKPWQGPQPRREPTTAAATAGTRATPALTARPTATPGPSPSPSPSPDPAIREARSRLQCKSPSGWRIVTIEESSTRRTRTMFPSIVMEAQGPGDPTIDGQQLFAAGLLAVGVCVPGTERDDVTAALARVSLWRLLPDGSAEEMGTLEPVDSALATLGEAYYAPPRSWRSAEWPAGRYVFEVTSDRTGGSDLWFALDYHQSAERAARSPISG